MKSPLNLIPFLDLTRSQTLNQADAVQKLRIAIFEAITPPKAHADTEEVKYIQCDQKKVAKCS